MKKTFIAVALLSLWGCGGSDEPTNNGDNTAPDNSRPSISAVISSATQFDERNSYVLAQASTADNPIASYAWSIASTPETVVSVSLQNASTATPTLVLGEVADTAEVELQLTVTDNAGNSSTTASSITLQEIDEAMLPPDPGAAGDETLAGIDSDNNGLRDDVERGIYYGNKRSQQDRNILNAASVRLQKVMEAGASTDSTQMMATSANAVTVAECIGSYLDERKQRKGLIQLEMLVANTYARTDAYAAYNASRNGTVADLTDPTLDQCLAIEGEE